MMTSHTKRLTLSDAANADVRTASLYFMNTRLLQFTPVLVSGG
jgi:hypothetical protein